MATRLDFLAAMKKGPLVGQNTGISLSIKEFVIDHFYRFEGISDPSDAMIVYAISSTTCDDKGVVVNAYGMYADEDCAKMMQNLAMRIK